jgi:hypothetical protein
LIPSGTRRTNSHITAPKIATLTLVRHKKQDNGCQRNRSHPASQGRVLSADALLHFFNMGMLLLLVLRKKAVQRRGGPNRSRNDVR